MVYVRGRKLCCFFLLLNFRKELSNATLRDAAIIRSSVANSFVAFTRCFTIHFRHPEKLIGM